MKHPKTTVLRGHTLSYYVRNNGKLYSILINEKESKSLSIFRVTERYENRYVNDENRDAEGFIVTSCCSCDSWKRTEKSWICDQCNKREKHEEDQKIKMNNRIKAFIFACRDKYPEWRPRKAKGINAVDIEECWSLEERNERTRLIENLALEYNFKVKHGWNTKGSKFRYFIKSYNPFEREFFEKRKKKK